MHTPGGEATAIRVSGSTPPANWRRSLSRTEHFSAAVTSIRFIRLAARALLVAVNCTQAAGTCFCTSMGTGPRCTAGFDLALTELAEGFVVEVGSQRGAELLNALSAGLVSTGMPAIAKESIAPLPPRANPLAWHQQINWPTLRLAVKTRFSRSRGN